MLVDVRDTGRGMPQMHYVAEVRYLVITPKRPVPQMHYVGGALPSYHP